MLINNLGASDLVVLVPLCCFTAHGFTTITVIICLQIINLQPTDINLSHKTSVVNINSVQSELYQLDKITLLQLTEFLDEKVTVTGRKHLIKQYPPFDVSKCI